MIGRLAASAPYWVTLAVSGCLYYVAEHISMPDTGDQLGPDFWPKLVLILMMLVCVYGVCRSMIFGSRNTGDGFEDIIERAPAPVGDDVTVAPPPKRYPLLLLAGAVVSVLYVALFDTLGFFLDTLFLLSAFILIGRYRRVGVALSVSLVGTLIFMFVFMRIVYVPLPLGSPPFSEVSILLMKLMGIR